MMLSDGSGLVFTVREFLSPLGMYVRSIDGKEPHAIILMIQINQNFHEDLENTVFIKYIFYFL